MGTETQLAGLPYGKLTIICFKVCGPNLIFSADGFRVHTMWKLVQDKDRTVVKQWMWLDWLSTPPVFFKGLYIKSNLEITKYFFLIINKKGKLQRITMEAMKEIFEHSLYEANAFLAGEKATGGTTHSPPGSVISSTYVPLPYKDKRQEMNAMAKVGLFLFACLVLYALYLFWQNGVLWRSNIELTSKVGHLEKLLRKYQPVDDD